MNKSLFLFVSLLLFSWNEVRASNPGGSVKGEVLAEAKNELRSEVIKGLGIISFDRTCVSKNSEKFYYLLKFNDSTDVNKKIKELIKSGLFYWAEPNGYMKACFTPNDSMFFREYGMNNTGNFNLTFSTYDSDSDLPEAWNIEQGDSNIIVAVLDGGIAFGHPEFAGRIWQNHNEIPANNIDDDGNGYTDDVKGWNFAYNSNDPADDLGHGTSVAGVLGANGNNAIGLAGVDWHCKIMVCKVLDNTNGGSYNDIANAIYYAADNGAQVINMSFAGGYSSLIAGAIQYAWNHNTVMFAATGNSNSSVPTYPASDTLVMAVGGSNAWDVRYIWSNYGNYIDVVAAGDYIYDLDYLNFNNYANYSSGTSLASPFVSGIASLLKAQRPSRTNQEICNIIRVTAQDLVDHYTAEDTPGWDQYFGFGRVNAYQALMYDSLHIGINTPSEDFACSIFPNPSHGIFSIRCSEEVNGFELVNVLGEKIAFANENFSRKEIDLSNEAKGIYFVKLYSEKGMIIRKMIID